MGCITMHVYSKAMEMTIGVSIVVPTLSADEMNRGVTSAEYYKPGMKYQTLWLLHGGGGDYLDYMRYSSIERYAEDNKVMVVMPSALNTNYANTIYGQNYWTFLSEELLQIVACNFPYSDSREDNFVAGFSMGAFGTMKYIANYPERFHAALAMSGGPWSVEFMVDDHPIIHQRRVFGDDADRVRYSCDDIYYRLDKAVQEERKMPKVFLAVGKDDMEEVLSQQETVYRFLKDRNVETELVKVDGYKHEWAFWDKYLEKAMYEWLPLKRCPIYGE